ncbi:SNF2-related protein [Deinococcus sp. LM3]|uniref:DEAD/DEAH box helicase n=2 Tax=Deinococcus TaxID=1298 RepID=UPI000993A7AA|nr:SNF2-related protein [Deinococcus sp. LM3]OOV11925.1 hypothetical protein BXU09_19435 [Deinococcus sp. LM3]
MTLRKGDQVSHAAYGVGTVVMVDDPTAVVRFDSGLQEVLLSDLWSRTTALQALRTGQLSSPVEAQLRIQAELITALNDTWGVFSRSRIALLPHQLWVCHRVLNTWPPRWLIADDVGLGKTIEAGLILWPLLSRRQVTRLLILAPASLTGQWQDRMKRMFDIRLTVYSPEQDAPTAKSGATYWDIHQQVIASMQTLRDDRKGRHARLLEAEPWDLVIVDEAHHLNVDEATGATLGYQLLAKLQEHGKIGGLLLFTATPHRGKDHGFAALLELLRPDLFSTEVDLSAQLTKFPQAVIRNNKQTVTDLQGRRLFEPPLVSSEEYVYSPEEAQFYDKLTEFITTGQAYAATLTSARDQSVIWLVLIALQKLASSSVAAVRRALRGRAAKVDGLIRSAEEATKAYEDLLQNGDVDAVSALEELVGEWGGGLTLMTNERQRLQELLDLADRVTQETKIQTVMDTLETRFNGRSVLFFTEYKATQSLLLSALIRKYGRDCVSFINGDGRADDVLGQSITVSRAQAAEDFNDGKVRFLVSTEAAGEGIDLQRACHTLIHVDLPWNPMRLHQRVGRLNRYGQTRRVEVLSLRNPGTVEALIWDKLNGKIQNIMRAFDAVMDEPEDLLQLVLGMTSPRLFDRLFSEGQRVGRSNLGDWFDQQTAQFGGQDVLKTVRDLIGHSASFDYQQTSSLIPRVDLPDLLPFFRLALRHNSRLLREEGDLMHFKTPEQWMGLGVLREYKNLAFFRGGDRGDVAGVGHKVVDAALQQSRGLQANVALTHWTGLNAPLYVFRVADRVTTSPSARRTFIGRLMSAEPRWLRDWELLQLLNDIKAGPDAPANPGLMQALADMLEDETSVLTKQLPDFNLDYAAPLVEPYAIFAPLPQ